MSSTRTYSTYTIRTDICAERTSSPAAGRKPAPDELVANVPTIRRRRDAKERQPQRAGGCSGACSGATADCRTVGLSDGQADIRTAGRAVAGSPPDK